MTHQKMLYNYYLIMLAEIIILYEDYRLYDLQHLEFIL